MRPVYRSALQYEVCKVRARAPGLARECTGQGEEGFLAQKTIPRCVVPTGRANARTGRVLKCQVTGLIARAKLS